MGGVLKRMKNLRFLVRHHVDDIGKVPQAALGPGSPPG